MTRCINCTRCVRFGEEIAGKTELGQLNRSENAEIGTFIDQAVTTELSGNMIDICPVGALTSKPYAFKARSWELQKTQTIDVHDAVGSNIRVDSRAGEVLRVLPRLHEDVNEEWINDRTRFSYDGLIKGRLDRPYLKDSITQKLKECSWEEALQIAGDKIKTFDTDNMAAFVGDLADAESIFSLKKLMANRGAQNIECRVDGAEYDASNKGSYRFNSTIAGIEDADAILIIGSNLRHEATLVNARIRKAWLEKRIPVAYVGNEVDMTYPATCLGNNISTLDNFVKAKGKFAKQFNDAEKPMIIIGNSVFIREDAKAVLTTIQEIADKASVVTENWNGYNVLQTAASRVAALEMDFVPTNDFALNEMGLVFLLGVDNPEVINNIHPHAFVVYQGSHGDLGAHRADLILPAAAYTEKDGIYMNLEGRTQRARRAVFPPGQAREDWKIIRAISDQADLSIGYNDIADVRTEMGAQYPALMAYDEIQDVELKAFKAKSVGKASNDPFEYPIDNFYLTNPICRASDIMKRCAQEFVEPKEQLEAAE